MENDQTSSLWDMVKNDLNPTTLDKVAERYPQFSKEAKALAWTLRNRNSRERPEMSFEDDMRAIGNDRL